MSATTRHPITEQVLAAHRARYITHPGHPTPFLSFASFDVAFIRRLVLLGVYASFGLLVWGFVLLLGIPAVADLVDGVVRGDSAATDRNGRSGTGDALTLVGGYVAAFGLIKLLRSARRWFDEQLPKRLVDPSSVVAVDVEAELGQEHRDLLLGLRARAVHPVVAAGAPLMCTASSRLLWTLAVAARVHRQLTLHTVARPDLMIGHDPRPKLLADLQEQIVFVAAVVEAGLTTPGRCLCVHRTGVSEDQLATAVERAAAVIPPPPHPIGGEVRGVLR